MNQTQNYGAPFSAYIRGTAEAIALRAAGGAGVVHYITDISGGSDAANTQLFVDSGTTTLFNMTLGSANTVPFSHSFVTPLRGGINAAVRVRVGSATSLSWAFIGGYTI